MARKGLEHAFPYLEVLSEKDVARIHAATLRVLEQTGVAFKDAAIRDQLAAGGCRVEAERVRFPEAVVMAALELCPHTFSGRARDPRNDVSLSAGQSSYFVNGCAMKTVDLDTWEVREPSRKEFYDHLKVIDALPNVDIQNCFPYFGFAKVPECMKLIESAAAKFRVSTKAQIEGAVFDNYRWTIAMAKAVDADVFQLVNSAAPLTYMQETTDQIRYYAESGMPFHFAAGPTRGLSGPVTMAGVLVANNAEALAGIALAQLLAPGARVWVNSMILTPNMKSGAPAFGDIGNSLTDAAFNQMWRYYRIPSWTNSSSWTSAKVIDYQAGYEMSTAALASALSGSTVLSLQGGLHAELTAHPVKAVIDDDLAGMIKRFVQGVDVTDESLAVELIDEIGPLPGSFLGTDHTLKWWRSESYMPVVASRDPLDKWEQSGQKNVLDIARQKTEAILAKHTITSLSPAQEAAIEAILGEARSYYRSCGLISDEEWRLYQEDLHSNNYPYA